MNTCSICGQIKYTPMLILRNNGKKGFYSLCSNCLSLYRRCPTCKHNTNCLFKTDPSPLPETIVQTINTPQGQVQANVINPERIKITCNKCKCADEGQPCNRNEQTCINYEFTVKS